MIWKNRGHFCNYCRVIVSNKRGIGEHSTVQLNQLIWYAWDNKDKRMEILQAIKDLPNYEPDVPHPIRHFNNQLKALKVRYVGNKEYHK